ncbi:MAG: hypothetical protein JSV82_03165 [Planctomycetota bacterium]|nr:MAG: hypothetical protein JSV82_03165 [Planctomycetota bacterium]
MRRIGKTIGVSTHKEKLTQQVYPDKNTSGTHTYTYYSCLYNPDSRNAIRQNYVA